MHNSILHLKIPSLTITMPYFHNLPKVESGGFNLHFLTTGQCKTSAQVIGQVGVWTPKSLNILHHNINMFLSGVLKMTILSKEKCELSTSSANLSMAIHTCMVLLWIYNGLPRRIGNPKCVCRLILDTQFQISCKYSHFGYPLMALSLVYHPCAIVNWCMVCMWHMVVHIGHL